MSRLIDADALIEFCAERWIPLNIDAVNMQPTIQPEPTDEQVAEYCKRRCLHIVTDDFFHTVQPEPHEGHWKKDETDDCPPVFRQFRICSVCGAIETSETNYCPNCGAKMTISK